MVGLNQASASSDAAARDQVDDENHHSNNKQEVDEASCDLQAESQEPEYEQDYKDCPEHCRFPLNTEHPEGRSSFRAFSIQLKRGVGYCAAMACSFAS
jgi:hypothetical protein